MTDPKESRIPDAAFLGAAIAAVLSTAWPLPVWAALSIKGLPLAILTLATASHAFKLGAGNYRKGIAAGFFFSLIGDVVIELNFLAGVGAFLLAHVCFIVAMGLPEKWIRQGIALLPAAALFVGMYFLLAGRIPADLFIPVLVYMGVICLMFGRAIGRAFEYPKLPLAWLMMVGATVFAFSDSMIAVNRWVLPIPNERLVILGSYFLAQFLIRLSVPAYEEPRNAPTLVAAPPL